MFHSLSHPPPGRELYVKCFVLGNIILVNEEGKVEVHLLLGVEGGEVCTGF